MSKQNIVIYHADCPDGFAAALAAWLKLRDTADYLPYQYGMAPPDVTGKAVYIVDFSFPREQVEALEAVATRVVLLDHHQTAIDKLAGYKCTCGKVRLVRDAKAGASEPATVHRHSSHTALDISKSGARLAWEYFHGQFDVPELVQFVEDRDLWLWHFGDHTRHFLAKLDSLPMDFPTWNRVLQMNEGERATFMAAGQAMCQKFDAIVATIAKEAVPVSVMGHQGLMVCGPRELASDVGALLAKQAGTFAAVWTLENTGQLKLSLRGVRGFDVRALAEAFGGGGHKEAAALRLPATRITDLVAGVLNPTPAS
ncbi:MULTISPECIES: DHHA1 domain-containing protein [unclassified Variovorax]|uniref:DHHA1 domain-containing protein n=1 Tax=unclassified Variovorax TaxID=663243 RepID=UPI0013181A51|nr:MULTISPECIES: DHHA1 domain-containing protein [unclassified Variovorax]VTU42683.1 putative phosphohydrolase (DHH superfamily) [Variovorax sp. PBL-H6]VTU43753.1 putative phosphohydrolase (DHH superfamily) [Variovorax sp. SRS16]VTU43819.1 putative phosphohydrolase (DHH superfamily) [Variovorax sp. PBL-E5]